MVNVITRTTNAEPTTSSAISDPTTTESDDGMLNYKHNIEGLEDYILWENPS